MTQSNSEIMRGLYEAFAKGDVPTVLGALDPNVSWEEFDAPGMPWAGKHAGPQTILEEVFMQIPANCAEYSVTPQEFIEAGDRVVILGNLHVKGQATGKAFDAPFAHVATLKNGKVARLQVFEDSGTLASVLK